MRGIALAFARQSVELALTNQRIIRQDKPVLLFVDDRPTTLGSKLFERDDVRVVLLRHEEHGFSQSHLDKTAHFPAYYRDSSLPENDQINDFLSWCDENDIKPQYILNPSEPEQQFAHKLGQRIGVPALTEDQVVWLRNKARMKDKFSEMGIACANYAEVKTSSDMVAFGEVQGWPIVVKPTEGFSCIDTYLLSSAEEASAHDLSDDTNWMVESYVEGQEWECCALIQDGQVLDTYASYMPARPLDIVDGAINANITVTPTPTDFPIDTKELVQRIVDGMELSDGYMHMEFFVNEKDGLVMSETALRLAGCEIPENHGLANGFDTYNTLIDIHIGRKVNLDYTKSQCAGDLLLPTKAGHIVGMTSEAELLNMPGVVLYKPRLQVGDVSDPKRAGHTCSAVVHVVGDTLEAVLSRMEYVLENFQMHTNPVVAVTKEPSKFGLAS